MANFLIVRQRAPKWQTEYLRRGGTEAQQGNPSPFTQNLADAAFFSKASDAMAVCIGMLKPRPLIEYSVVPVTIGGPVAVYRPEVA